IAAKNVPLKKGGEILLISEQFPSNVYVWQELAQSEDQTLHFIQKSSDIDLTSQILDKLSDQTSLISIPNVHWADGTKIDLKAVSQKCKLLDICLVIDGTQSIGVMDFDVSEIQPDFLIASTYKWLLGPYSLGFLYCDEKYFEGQPIEHGWINKKGSEDFSKLVDYQPVYELGASRSDMGGLAQFHLVSMATEALKQILKWGVTNIEETLSHHTDYLSEQVKNIGLTTLKKELRCSHILGVFEDKQAFSDQIAKLFKEHNIFVSFRGDSMRLGPHLYNSKEQFDDFIEVLKKGLVGR
ncbi:aminotransferase class V-fold PLP-dependent enzyme, partial [bacterium]|nr:aminotransferase class V-fold PLP-dependent enzyme [bacterium]